MASDRHTPTILTDPGGVDDDDYATDVDEEVHALWDRALCFLSSVAGTNTITATCTPTLDAYAQSMRFAFIAAADNTGAVTFNIDGVGAREVRDQDGDPLLGGEITADRLHVIIDDGTYFRLIQGAGAGGSGALGVPGLMLEDRKATGTAGGTFTNGAWRTRVLNTVVRNVLAGASLGSSQVTLQPGTYVAHWSAPAHNVDQHITRLRNITDGSTIGTGTSEDAGTGGVNTRSLGWVVFTLTSAKVIELQHRAATTVSSNGFGDDANVSNAHEVYSQLSVWTVGAADSSVEGRHGGGITIEYTFDAAISEADPGNGKLRLNSATPGDTGGTPATKIFADLLARDLTDYQLVLETVDGGEGRLVKSDDPTKWLIFTVTARTDESGYKDFDITVIDGSESQPFTDDDRVLFMMGSPGPAGPQGAAGADGADPGVLYNWDDDNTDSDPGSGDIKADNDALGSATQLFVSKTARGGDDVAGFLLSLDDSTNTVKGHVILTRTSDEAQAVFEVTGVTDATGYVKVAIQGHSGATGFTLADAISFQFARAGDSGTDVDAIHDNVSGEIDAVTEKSALAVTDLILIEDSEDSGDLYSKKSAQIGNLPAATTLDRGTVERASVAEARDPSVDGKYPTVKDLYDAAAEVALSDGANISLDLDTGIDFTVTLAGNRTLDNPTNVTVGKRGRIRVVQDVTGSRTLAFGANYEFAGGTAPTLTTAANAEDVLYYDCISATRILVASVLDIS